MSRTLGFRRGLRLTALSLCLIWTSGAVAEDAALAELRAKHFCRVVAYLRAIHAHPPSRHNRYLVLEPVGRVAYVQCLYYQLDRRILCEAASGYYEVPRRELVAPERYPILRDLGYATPAVGGNYKQRRSIKGDQSLAEVAEIMIRTLHDIFDVVPSDTVEYKAPFVPDPPEPGVYENGQCIMATS